MTIPFISNPLRVLAATETARCDLHTHSTASDGLFAPPELVARAHAAGLALIALSDHDTTEGIAAAQQASLTLDIRVMPAIELNTDLPGRHSEAHVLGYDLDVHQPALQATLQLLRDARTQRGQRIVERLHTAGVTISWARVRELAQGSVGRPHVAQALVEHGDATSIADAFDRYLSFGRPGYVPRLKLTPADAVRLIRSAYGVPVLAHPADIPDLEALVASLVAAGLLGLECHYGEYDDDTVTGLTQLAATHGLIVTGGSDYHGPGLHPTPLGGRFVPAAAATLLTQASGILRQAPATTFALPAQPA